ncbi:MAG: hypothetical protein Q4D44_07150 [Eubacteriales bacterium]|nr:hypothetical protein [Eubacteriales bacterium]
MKKICVVLAVFILVCFSVVDVSAVSDNVTHDLENSLGLEQLYDSLSSDAKKSLERMGVYGFGKDTLESVSFQSVLAEILRIAGSEGVGIFSLSGLIIAVMLLYGAFEGLGDSICSMSMKKVLSVSSSLLISCALLVPATEVIKDATEMITAAADFMLAYIPIMFMVMISCSSPLSASGYYAMMTGLSQVIAQLSAKFIAPMLNVFLGVSVAGSIVPELKITGILNTFSKSVKWILSFSFTIFSALLGFKTLISTSVDNVSARAVRYTMSSFVPVVGAALSEAYKTVEGSVRILKNGIGVFVIFAIGAVFLPIVIKLLLWLLTLNMLKSFGEVVNLTLPCSLLSGVSSVLGVILAIILCVAALFIISTALIITVGGGVS